MLFRQLRGNEIRMRFKKKKKKKKKKGLSLPNGNGGIHPGFMWRTAVWDAVTTRMRVRKRKAE